MGNTFDVLTDQKIITSALKRTEVLNLTNIESPDRQTDDYISTLYSFTLKSLNADL